MEAEFAAVAYLRIWWEADRRRRIRATATTGRAVARVSGFTIIDIYRYQRHKGTQRSPRSGNITRSLDSNGVRVVLVERADRLARDLMISEVIIGQSRASALACSPADGADS
jgi:hypothetical protein